MAADPHDWIDRALTQSAWEPPAGFTNDVVRQAMAILPRRISLRDRLTLNVLGFRESIRVRVEGWTWALTQLSHLVWGGHGSLR